MSDGRSERRPAPLGIYRFTSIARPVDPAYPTNRALLFVLPALALVSAGIAWLTEIGDSPAGAAFSSLLVAFASWALTRELAPDDDAAAFLALAIAWPAALLLGADSVLLVFVALFLIRIVNRSTGLACRPFDTISVLGLSIFASYSLEQPLLLLVAAVAFGLDAWLRDGHRLHYAAAAVCAGAFAWFAFGRLSTNLAPAADWLWFAAIAAACGVVMFTTRSPESVCDVYSERLHAARVNAGLGIGLLVGAEQLASIGSSAWVSTPLFACLIAVPISAAATRLFGR